MSAERKKQSRYHAMIDPIEVVSDIDSFNGKDGINECCQAYTCFGESKPIVEPGPQTDHSLLVTPALSRSGANEAFEGRAR